MVMPQFMTRLHSTRPLCLVGLPAAEEMRPLRWCLKGRWTPSLQSLTTTQMAWSACSAASSWLHSVPLIST